MLSALRAIPDAHVQCGGLREPRVFWEPNDEQYGGRILSIRLQSFMEDEGAKWMGGSRLRELVRNDYAGFGRGRRSHRAL